MSEPKAYELTNPNEIDRLMRELYGYLKVCIDEHHGTDYKGRRFALIALEQIITGTEKLKRGEPWERRKM